MIEVILFDENDNEIVSMFRNIVPRVGEGIDITDTHIVEVIAVSHQWDSVDVVFLLTKRKPEVNQIE